MGSLSIPGIVAKAGRRQDTQQPPTAPRAAPPAAADPARPLEGAAAAAPTGLSAAAAREIPPLQARQARLRHAHWLAATPVTATGLAGKIPSPTAGCAQRCDRADRPVGERASLSFPFLRMSGTVSVTLARG